MQSSQSRLHLTRTLIRSPSLSQRLALRTPAIMTMRGEGDSRRIDLGSTHGMRYSNITRAETQNTHLEGWSGTNDEGSLGRQQFHA